MKKLTYISLVLMLFSCEMILFEKDLATTDPLANFDYLWSEIDRKYSYFELKNIDWDQIRSKYRGQLSATSDDLKLFEVLGAMMNELRDDHTNLITPFNVSVYNIESKFPVNFRQRTVSEFYVPNAWTTGPFRHDFIFDQKIGYIRYGSFLSDFREDQLDLILRRYRDTDGLILDLRSNGGGSVINVQKILSRFTESELLVGYSITRNGPGRNDFGQPEEYRIKPSDKVKYTKPVVLLIDRGSYSATTIFALASKAFPNITSVGDTTGGGGGLPNGGQLPNGWVYRFSVSQLLDLQKENFAENGVAPDFNVQFDWTNLEKDEIIEFSAKKIINRELKP
jgi:C-terminal processing protease CtpA/Prc